MDKFVRRATLSFFGSGHDDFLLFDLAHGEAVVGPLKGKSNGFPNADGPKEVWLLVSHG